MSKKVLSLVLALVMVLGSFGTVFAAEGSGNAKVDALVDLGLVKGYEDGSFGLTQAITRAEMATMVVRALDLEEVAKASAAFPSQFTDMNSANVLWARGHVNVAAGQGIVNGYPEGTFLPANNVTYAEAAAMLVRVKGGLTAAEEANAVWPTTYLAKAAQLGIFNGVEGVVDYNAPALRGKLFEMVYNAIINLQAGNYQIVKAIVLENYRVEKLDKDEVVVEIIEEVQRAKFVEESRKDMRGEQLSLDIPAKLGDVENLLGKVANFTLDKDGNVVAIAIDGTYKTEVLTEEDTVTSKKFGSYTVELSERYKDSDERIFRTYYNNEAYSYEEFVKELGRDALVEYAKVTTKNGKVVYIDAFNFTDIAPVKEVKSEGATVVVYNDLREGTTKNISLKATDDILFVTEGNISVGTREEIEVLDVIHEYKGGFIVRKDATVDGTYEKVTSNRDNEYFVNVEGEKYLISETTGKQAVYAYDEDEFYNLGTARTAGATLREFEDEEVTIALDLTDKLQYIGAEVEMAEFVGIATRVVGDKVRVLKSDDKTYDYVADLDTKVDGSRTGHKGLNDIDAGDLVYMAVDGDTIDEIKVLTKGNVKVDSLTSREIDLADGEAAYRLLSNTLYFRSQGTTFEALTAKQAKDAFDKATTELKAYVLTGEEAVELFGRRAPIDKAGEAYVVVFTQIQLTSKTKTHIVQFDGWANNRKTEMTVRYEDNTTEELAITDDVYFANVDKIDLASRDIIEIVATDDDNKDISKVTRLIAYNRDDVYEVVSFRKDELSLKDSQGNPYTFYTVDAEEFGGSLATAKRVKISIDAGKYLDAVLVVSSNWEITANPASQVPETGLKVLAINTTDKLINIAGTVYNYAFASDVADFAEGAFVTFDVQEVNGKLFATNFVEITPAP